MRRHLVVIGAGAMDDQLQLDMFELDRRPGSGGPNRPAGQREAEPARRAWKSEPARRMAGTRGAAPVRRTGAAVVHRIDC